MLAPATRSLGLLVGAFLAGCGGGDGPPAITVASAAGPLVGTHVVFHDADGVPIVHATTDADGRAEGDIDDGGMITVLLGDAGGRSRATFGGVARGDELRLTARAPIAEVGTARVVVAPFAGAAVYVIQAACASVYTADVSQPIDVEIRSNCLAPDGTLPLLVTARGSDGSMMAAASVRDVVWAEPMHVVMPAWRAPAVLTVEAMDAPPGTLGVMVSLGYLVDGVYLEGPSDGQRTAAGEDGFFALPYPAGFADRLQTWTSVYAGPSLEEPTAATMRIDRLAALPAVRTIELTAGLLPMMSPPVYELAVVGRPVLRWVAGEAPAADAGAATFDWNEPGAGYQEWSILFPPDVAGSVQLPALPAELATWAPPAAASFGRGTVLFADADWVTGYDELRRGPGMAIALRDLGAIFPDADAAARFTIAGDL